MVLLIVMGLRDPQECSRRTRGVEAGPTAEGDKDCDPLRRHAGKTAHGWALLTFFVDRRPECSTLGPFS